VPKPSEPAANVVLVLDSSESMASLIDGKAKIDLSKAFVQDFLSKVRLMRVGLRAVGTHPYATKAQGCLDSNRLVGVATGTVAQNQAQVATLVPKGLSPVKLAVSQAVDDLTPLKDTKAVVLVSDGLDVCLPPGETLCSVAVKLKANGIRAFTIGFDVNPAGRAQLQCLASSTGGQYYEARNSAQFTSAVANLFNLPPA
jgi:Ca-activated chloride channel family protein